MPRGKNGAKDAAAPDSAVVGYRRTQPKDEWAGFVQVSLTEEHREEFDLWLSSMGDAVNRELDDALATGLKFSLAHDGENCCYIASLIGRPDLSGKQPFSACLSARGGTMSEAIAVLVYKHAELLHFDWWELVNNPKKYRSTFG